MIQSINHVTYSVSNTKHSITFYKDILKAKILVESDKTVYFILGGLWLALNEEKDIYLEMKSNTRIRIWLLQLRKVNLMNGING